MNDTGFVVSDPIRLATPYGEGVPPERMGETYKVNGELGSDLFFVPDRIFNLASFHSGGAGMAGTAGDFLRFLQAIRKGGSPILKPETLAEAKRNQIGNLPRPEAKDAGWRFGLLSAVLDDPAPTGSPLSRGTLEWGGAYGHGWFVDFDAGVSVVSFTNTAVEGCLGQFPRDIRGAVIG
jgi:CubicO group peptidase (beta-lactamase class C family)